MASNSTNANSFLEDNRVSLIDEITDAATAKSSSGGLSGGAIAGIVIAVVVGVLLIGVLGFFALKYVKDRRKNHGEYRPQFEEQHHAKDLPYLQPPNLEGLI
uniref:Syndecan n=1 Tax=Caenorhabditis tropicalis TaxID=1561998 RepID=A0A1I7TZP2_9PELO